MYAIRSYYVWIQEEPRNAGAWDFVRHQLIDLTGKDPEYIGRDQVV